MLDVMACRLCKNCLEGRMVPHWSLLGRTSASPDLRSFDYDNCLPRRRGGLHGIRPAFHFRLHTAYQWISSRVDQTFGNDSGEAPDHFFTSSTYARYLENEREGVIPLEDEGTYSVERSARRSWIRHACYGLAYTRLAF